ncbi:MULTISPECIES: transporter [Sphingomonas]|jgi:ZIP family zinc transporter|uniref:Transporter n=1 Tax=Sphingomonas ginsenosidivorax TaxID=862135 RepID=A0A5C6UDA7_9SPHN|nr:MULTISPECIES: transporter [Sphingomonas]TCP96110.1 ZIP family zinc transporter [Sphingomonas sp. PP-F2F-A104-K0414]TCQ06453.1 ZIP family zinc transporter [Sphingomonas sp. PP-CC-3A-396]TXC69938.1 transporter [Sphingomonas ginsenosidivorax]
MQAVAFTLIPVVAVLIGSLFAVSRRPSDAFVSAMQHLAAGVVFAAAAAEILPQVMHEGSPIATFTGGALGIVVMLSLKALEGRASGPIAMLGAVAVDILIDGLVLGLAFVAGGKAGVLLTIALTLEVLFLGLTVTTELGETIKSKARIIGITMGIALLLPIGAAIATPVATFPPVVIAGFLSFGLMALLYLVTEELLVEAHEKPDTPLISAMFFIGFLGLLLIEEFLG